MRLLPALMGFLIISSSPVIAQAGPQKPAKAPVVQRAAAAKGGKAQRPRMARRVLAPLGRVLTARKQKRAARKAALGRSSRVHIYRAHKLLGALGALAGVGALAIVLGPEVVPDANVFSAGGVFDEGSRKLLVPMGLVVSTVTNIVAYIDSVGLINEEARNNQ